MDKDHSLDFAMFLCGLLVIGAWIKYPPAWLVAFFNWIGLVLAVLGCTLLYLAIYGLLVFVLYEVTMFFTRIYDMFKLFNWVKSRFPEMEQRIDCFAEELDTVKTHQGWSQMAERDIKNEISKLKKKISELEAPTSSVVVEAVTELQKPTV